MPSAGDGGMRVMPDDMRNERDRMERIDLGEWIASLRSRSALRGGMSVAGSPRRRCRPDDEVQGSVRRSARVGASPFGRASTMQTFFFAMDFTKGSAGRVGAARALYCFDGGCCQEDRWDRGRNAGAWLVGGRSVDVAVSHGAAPVRERQGTLPPVASVDRGGWPSAVVSATSSAGTGARRPSRSIRSVASARRALRKRERMGG